MFERLGVLLGIDLLQGFLCSLVYIEVSVMMDAFKTLNT